MGQTIRVPLQALKVVPEAPEISVSMDALNASPEDLAAIEAKYRSGEIPLSVAVDQLQPEPAPQAPQRGMVQKAMGAGPMIGSTIGGYLGGVPGAALGGAAGVGFEELVRNAGEIPGAIGDVGRGLVEHPRETLAGAVKGMTEGAETAGLSGALNASLEYGGQKAMQAIGAGAKAVYRGYLKPSLAGRSIKDAQTIVDTAIAEGLPISKFGKEKAERIIGELNGQVKSILQNRQHISKSLHGDIDLHDIADQVRQFARDTYYKAGRPSEDFEAAMRVADNIDAHPSLNVPPGSAPTPQPHSLTEANEVKRTLQNSAGDRAYGVERSAATEAEKRGGYVLRKEIEKRAPDVAHLNARESKLLDAAKAINHAIERDANQNALYGVKTIGAGLYGSAEYGRTKDPTSAFVKALTLRVALTPAIATRLAIVASRVGQIPGIAPATAARVALAAISESSDQANDAP